MTTEVPTTVLYDLYLHRFGEAPTCGMKASKELAIFTPLFHRINLLLREAGRRKANQVVLGDKDTVLENIAPGWYDRHTGLLARFSSFPKRPPPNAAYATPFCIIQLAAQQGVPVHG